MWLQKINVKAVPDKYNAGDNADVKEMCINLPIPTNAILHDEVIVKVRTSHNFDKGDM